MTTVERAAYTRQDMAALSLSVRTQSIEADIRAAVAQGFRSAKGALVPSIFRRTHPSLSSPVCVAVSLPFVEVLGEALDQAHLVGLMLEAHREPMMGRALAKLQEFEHAVADFLVDRDALVLAKLAEGL